MLLAPNTQNWEMDRKNKIKSTSIFEKSLRGTEAIPSGIFTKMYGSQIGRSQHERLAAKPCEFGGASDGLAGQCVFVCSCGAYFDRVRTHTSVVCSAISVTANNQKNPRKNSFLLDLV